MSEYFDTGAAALIALGVIGGILYVAILTFQKHTEASITFMLVVGGIIGALLAFGLAAEITGRIIIDGPSKLKSWIESLK